MRSMRAMQTWLDRPHATHGGSAEQSQNRRDILLVVGVFLDVLGVGDVFFLEILVLGVGTAGG
jgi:hypothetical protein